jgi:hypothetical protein
MHGKILGKHIFGTTGFGMFGLLDKDGAIPYSYCSLLRCEPLDPLHYHTVVSEKFRCPWIAI